MNHTIAFLRAVNVGGRFIKMEDLRQQFEALGLQDVQTYIQSGNVIFKTKEADHTQLEGAIEARLEAAFGFQVPAMIRTAAEFTAVANYEPFSQSHYGEKSVLYISFLKEAVAPERQRDLLAFTNDIDEFQVHDRQAYWLMHRHHGQSKFTNNKLERALGVTATRRNSSTVRKIAAKYF